MKPEDSDYAEGIKKYAGYVAGEAALNFANEIAKVLDGTSGDGKSLDQFLASYKATA